MAERFSNSGFMIHRGTCWPALRDKVSGAVGQRHPWLDLDAARARCNDSRSVWQPFMPREVSDGDLTSQSENLLSEERLPLVRKSP